MLTSEKREKSSRSDEFISAPRAMRKTARFVSLGEAANKEGK
jgi:hypothetical protein